MRRKVIRLNKEGKNTCCLSFYSLICITNIWAFAIWKSLASTLKSIMLKINYSCPLDVCHESSRSCFGGKGLLMQWRLGRKLCFPHWDWKGHKQKWFPWSIINFKLYKVDESDPCRKVVRSMVLVSGVLNDYRSWGIGRRNQNCKRRLSEQNVWNGDHEGRVLKLQ